METTFTRASDRVSNVLCLSRNYRRAQCGTVRHPIASSKLRPIERGWEGPCRVFSLFRYQITTTIVSTRVLLFVRLCSFVPAVVVETISKATSRAWPVSYGAICVVSSVRLPKQSEATQLSRLPLREKVLRLGAL